MTTALRPFWEQPEFLEIVPFIRVTVPMDKRAGRSPRFDLKSATPIAVVAKALSFKGRCPACGALMSPFRARSAEQKRGHGDENVYLAVTCPMNVRIGCSRGRKSSDAMQAVWALCRAIQAPEGKQGDLFDE